MKLCILLALHVIVLVGFVYGDDEEWKCEPSTPYQENDCNSCFCTENKVLGCTERACVDTADKDPRQCEVGTSWKKDCNQCWCVKDLGTVCAANKC